MIIFKFSFLKSLLLPFFFMVTISLMHIANALQVEEVRVGIFDNKPMCYFDGEGKPAGIFVSVVEYVASKEGWKLVYVKGSFSSLRKKLEKGEIDILLSTAVSEERKKLYSYNSVNVFNNWAEVYILPKIKISSLLDLKDKRIATLEKGIYSTGPEGIIKLDEQFHLNTTFVFVNDYKSGLKAVRDGSADAAVVNRLVGAMYGDEFGLQKSGIVFAPVKIHFALNKQSTKTPLLIKALDEHMKALTQDSNSIYHQSISTAIGGYSNRTVFPKWLLILFMVAVVSILLFIVFVLILKKQVKAKTKALLQANDELERSTKQLRLSKKELAQQHAEFQAIFNSMSDAIVFVDTERRIIMLNPAFKSIFGYNLKDLEGKITQIIYANAEDYYHQGKNRYNKDANNDFPVYEVEYRRKDGSVFSGQTMGVTVYNQTAEVIGFLGVIRDVTDNKNAEKEKLKLEIRLQQAQKMEAIGTLAGGIAHDFNNILGIISGYTELAQNNSPIGSKNTNYLNNILVATNRATDLVKQILSFSRQSNSKRVPLQLQAIIKENLKMLRASIPSTIEIEDNLDLNCGIVLADPTHIHQILMNLSTNAGHAMEKSGGTLKIELKSIYIEKGSHLIKQGIVSGESVELIVSDTGCGIDPKIIGNIFDPYFTSKELEKGTGMGLAIIHGIIAEYRGIITVESELGKGTSFHIYIPVIRKKDLQIVAGLEKNHNGEGRVLFVDDEPLLAELGKEMIEQLGYEVTSCQSSLKALTIFQTNPENFDIVITDQTMPGMTGSDLAKRLLQIRPNIPIILCTGCSILIDEKKAKSIGIKELALKPLTRNMIAALLQKTLV